LLVVDLFQWFISSWLNFVKSNTPRNVPISSRFSSLFDYRFSKFLHELLDCIGIRHDIPFFVSNFIYLGLFSTPSSQIG
jgi:hypothetical protein